MRIALVSPFFLPHVGGVEKHVAALAGEFSELGHNVEVFTQVLPSERLNEYVDPGYRVRRFTSIVNNQNAIFAPEMLRTLRREQSLFDVVHAHSYHTSVPLSVATVVRRFVLTPHFHGGGHTRLRNLAHGPYRRAFSLATKRVTAMIAVSTAEAEALRRAFPACVERIHLSSNGVNAPAVREPRVVTQGPHGLVLVAGRLEGYKRVDTIIEACAQVPGARLVVCGDGPERTHLEEAARRLMGARAEFLGWVTDAELVRLRGRADVVVNLSEHEAFGLIGAEALVAGSRVLLSDIPAHRELTLLDEHQALTLVPANVEAAVVARQLAMLLEQGPSLPSKLVPTWRQVAEQHLQIYALALGVGKKRTGVSV